MENDVAPDWVFVAVGLLFVFDGVFALVSGRTRASYQDRCGLTHYVDVSGEQNPIQFLARVMLSLLIGTALISYGVYRMLGWM